MSIPGGEVWVHGPGVWAVELDGEAVLFDERSERLHLLNASATIIWSCLDGEVSTAELTGELAEAFGLSERAMAADVAEAVQTMVDAGLLRPARPRRVRASAPA